MNKFIIIAIFISSLACMGCAKNNESVNLPTSCFDEQASLKTAEIVWLKTYGNVIENEKPFIVTEKNNTWIVEGTLHGEVGGVAYAEIQKSDCKVLQISHGR